MTGLGQRKRTGLCLLANDLGRDDLLAVDVILDVNLLSVETRYAIECQWMKTFFEVLGSLGPTVRGGEREGCEKGYLRGRQS